MTNRELALQAWESLFRAQHQLLAEMAVDFEGSDLTQGEYDVLLTVVRAPGMASRLRDITAKSLISQPSVSRLIDRMVTRGLVSKTIDPDDGRGAVITATDAGAKAFRQLATVHGRTIAEKMSNLDDDELATLLELTQKLRGV